MLRTITIAAAVVVAVAAFAATSWALRSGDEPRLRAELGASRLPVTKLDSTEAIRLNNLVSDVNVSRFGITPSSYDQVRVLGRTAAGLLYLIPGSRGECLALSYAAACGDPGAPGQRVLAEVVRDPSRKRLVGGGIAIGSVRTVTLATRKRVLTRVPVVDGMFTISTRARVRPGEGMHFVAR
jgi:hypothetical protein